MPNLPLKDLLVLEIGQNLSAPLATLRLADMGARVIRIEFTGQQQPMITAGERDTRKLLHHQAINRNKESLLVDTTKAADRQLLYNLLTRAQILIQNLPGAFLKERELDYPSVQAINPLLVYGCISGYGSNTHWTNLPDTDTLLQSLSGLAYTTGNLTDHPMPFGTAIADKLCSAQLVQGVLAAMIRRQKTGKGALVEISLLESLLDFQFELLTTYYSCGQVPVRSQINNGHALLSAPYGIYATANGYIAIAMVDLQKLSKAIECPELMPFTPKDAFARRDEIKELLGRHLKKAVTAHWLRKMQEQDLWTMEVLSWQQLTAHPAYKCLQMEQKVWAADFVFTTTRNPIRLGGEKIYSPVAAPYAGQHNARIAEQFA